MAKHNKMPKTWLLGLVLILAGTAAHAAVTLEGTKATGITGLDIGLPDLYDITFERVTGAPVPNLITLEPCAPSGPPCDLFGTPPDETAAQTAADAIRVALNSVTALTVGPAGGTFSKNFFDVPYDATGTCDDGGDPGICVWKSSYFTGPGWILPPSPTFEFSDQADVVFARFTPSSVVPVPPAVFLFTSGMALLGWVSRRRRAVAA